MSDPTNPQRDRTLPIGGYSEVEWDHKAFLYWPEDGTIVLPVSPGWNDCGPADDCLAEEHRERRRRRRRRPTRGTRAGRARGTISTSRLANQSGCWNPLQRSMVIDDEMVTVGLDQMKFTDRATLGTP